ncbi:MAG: hypothetical protein ABEH88_00245, partial [Halobacteriales archaeon]
MGRRRIDHVGRRRVAVLVGGDDRGRAVELSLSVVGEPERGSLARVYGSTEVLIDIRRVRWRL